MCGGGLLTRAQSAYAPFDLCIGEAIVSGAALYLRSLFVSQHRSSAINFGWFERSQIGKRQPGMSAGIRHATSSKSVARNHYEWQ